MFSLSFKTENFKKNVKRGRNNQIIINKSGVNVDNCSIRSCKKFKRNLVTSKNYKNL